MAIIYCIVHPNAAGFKALETLGRFETMTAKLGAESKLLSSARDALSLEPMERDVLGPMQAEITDLREASFFFLLAWKTDGPTRPCLTILHPVSHRRLASQRPFLISPCSMYMCDVCRVVRGNRNKMMGFATQVRNEYNRRAG